MSTTNPTTAAACLSFALLLASHGTAFAQPASSADVLNEDVQRVRKEFEVPGIAIAIVKDGKVQDVRGFGVRTLGNTAAVGAQTQFDIAANSKAFTAALLAMLVDEGKLKWDDPVVKHLPQFQMFDPWVSRAMTIRDLLANRSGLGDGAGDLMWWPSSTFSTDEIIHNLRYLAPTTSFRSTYTYEYLPYIVAGKIIALHTGKPWSAAVRERILSPLGMRHTSTSTAESAAVTDFASPHGEVDGKLSVIKAMPMDNAAGAMGVVSSAEDLAKWMNALLDGGKVAASGGDGARRLYSAAQARELWTPQTVIRVNEPKPPLARTRASFAAYGLGFDLRDYQGYKVVSHRGWQFGQYSSIVMVPSAGLGIAILSNAESGPALNALKFRLLDRYLGLAPNDWITAVQQAAKAGGDDEDESAPRPTGAPSLALAAYDGEYRDAWYGSATVKTVAGRQTFSMGRSPSMTGELKHVGQNTFSVRWKERSLNADAYVTFTVAPEGRITPMTMAPISSETDSSFDFKDLSFTPLQK